MRDRDALIDGILEEVAAHRNAGYEKSARPARLDIDQLVADIVAESAGRRAVQTPAAPAAHAVATPASSAVVPEQPAVSEASKPAATQIPEPEAARAASAIDHPSPASESVTPMPEQQPEEPAAAEKTNKKSRRKKKEQDDPLAAITPWSQRHADPAVAPDAGKTGFKAGRSGESGRNVRSFLHFLKKNQPDAAPAQPELLYKNTGAVRPPVEEEPVSKDPGPLRSVSADTFEHTIQVAALRSEELEAATRAIPSLTPAAPPAQVDGQTAIFNAETPAPAKTDEITGQVRLDGYDAEPQPQPREAWQEELEESRQHKASQFKMAPLHFDDDAVAAASVEEDGEYHTTADYMPLKMDLLSRCRGVKIRFWVTALLGVLILLLSITDAIDVSNGLLTDNPLLMLGLYGVLLLLTAAVNGRVIFGGLASLFRGGDSDSPAAAAWAACVLQTAAALALGAPAELRLSTSLFGCSAVVCLLFNLLGRRFMLMRIYRNLNLIGNDKEKNAAVSVVNREDAFELGRGLSIGTPAVALARKCVNPRQFMYHSYAPDRAELSARLPMILLPLFGAVGAVLTYFFTPHETASQLVLLLIFGFCGGVCAALPTTALLAGNAVFYRAQSKLLRRKIMISGYDTVQQFKDVDVLAIDAAQLFPAGSISLQSIKSASNQSLDRSLMDVAGVVYMADSPLKSIFENIIQGKTAMLPEVDTLVYEEEMGISGWVMGYRVLVGTRKLMENHGVIIPDTDYEDQSAATGLRAVYLSTQGVLSAIFLVRYTPDAQVAAMLKKAVDAGLTIHVYSCDPNLTREMICRMFRLPSASVRVMGTVARRVFKRQANEDQADALLTYEGGADRFCRGMTMARKLYKAINFAAVLQMLFVVAGIGLFAAGLVVAGLRGFNGLWLALYQLAAGLLTVFLPRVSGR